MNDMYIVVFQTYDTMTKKAFGPKTWGAFKDEADFNNWYENITGKRVVEQGLDKTKAQDMILEDSHVPGIIDGAVDAATQIPKNQPTAVVIDVASFQQDLKRVRDVTARTLTERLEYMLGMDVDKLKEEVACL